MSEQLPQEATQQPSPEKGTKSTSADPAYVYVIFPYLKTQKAVRVRGVTLHPSTDLARLADHARDQVATLSALFYLRGDYRIAEVTAAAIEIHEPKELSQVFEQVRRVQSLIAYMYAQPRPLYGDIFLSTESATVFIFMETSVSPYILEGGPGTVGPERPVSDTIDSNYRPPLPGYEGLRDFQDWLWVSNESRIYPSHHGQTLNISQDIEADIEQYLRSAQNWPMIRLFTDDADELSAHDKKLFTSLLWYNRSSRLQISEDQSLVHLSIAFESLLGLSNSSQLTERFEEFVKILLGDFPRLDSWVSQFYTARSKIVHEGSYDHLGFLPVERGRVSKAVSGSIDVEPYRSLNVYGRQIYRLCMLAILTGASIAALSRIEESLVHSQERIDTICKALSSTGDHAANIRSIARDVSSLQDQWLIATQTVREESLVGISKLALIAIIALRPHGRDWDTRALERILGSLGAKSIDHRELISQAASIVKQSVSVDTDALDVEIDEFAVVANLLEFAARALPIRI